MAEIEEHDSCIDIKNTGRINGIFASTNYNVMQVQVYEPAGVSLSSHIGSDETRRLGEWLIRKADEMEGE